MTPMHKIMLNKECYEGDWLNVDWPFSRILRIIRSKTGDYRVCLFDIDVEDARRLLQRRNKATEINVSSFRILKAQWNDEKGLFLRVRFSLEVSPVEYIFKCHGLRDMSSECCWVEDFVNVTTAHGNQTGSQIVGEWRYYQTEFSSLIIKIRNLVGHKKALEVIDSESGRLIESENVQIGESEVSFSLPRKNMKYRLVARNRQSAFCYCTNANEKWSRISCALEDLKFSGKLFSRRVVASY